MEVNGYTEFGYIDACFDGSRMAIPDDLGNRHRQLIAEWEAEGNTIPAYVPPAPDPFPNLEPDQFWFVLRASGYAPDLLAWVANLNDPGTAADPNPAYNPVAWAEASAKLDFAKYFERYHPLVAAAREAIGMSETELDDLWCYAAS